MEGVLHDISYVLVYIDDLLIHMDTNEKHLEVLDKVLVHLQKISRSIWRNVYSETRQFPTWDLPSHQKESNQERTN
jgi:hypothetical protein